MPDDGPFQVALTIQPTDSTGGVRALRAILDTLERTTYSECVHRRAATKALTVFEWVADNDTAQTVTFALGNAITIANLLRAGVRELVANDAAASTIADARATAGYVTKTVQTATPQCESV